MRESKGAPSETPAVHVAVPALEPSSHLSLQLPCTSSTLVLLTSSQSGICHSSIKRTHSTGSCRSGLPAGSLEQEDLYISHWPSAYGRSPFSAQAGLKDFKLLLSCPAQLYGLMLCSTRLPLLLLQSLLQSEERSPTQDHHWKQNHAHYLDNWLSSCCRQSVGSK